MKTIVLLLLVAFAAFAAAAQNYTFRANGTNMATHGRGTFPNGQHGINSLFGNRGFNTSGSKHWPGQVNTFNNTRFNSTNQRQTYGLNVTRNNRW